MIQVTMLGSFEMWTEKDGIKIEARFSNKSNSLIGFLLMHPEQVSTKEEILDAIWGDDTKKNPISALKTLISRTRTQLNETFGENDYILSLHHGYQWNPEIAVRTDVKQIYEYYCSVKNPSIDDFSRIKSAEEAIRLYKGKFMIDTYDHPWCVMYNHYFHSENLKCINQLAELYFLHEKYAELETLCQLGLVTDRSNEDFHYYLIQAKTKLQKTQEAIHAYNYALQMIQKDLGVNSVPKIQELWPILNNMKENEREKKIDQIEEEMIERISQGAFLCSFSVFKSICNLESYHVWRENCSANQESLIKRQFMLISINKESAQSLDTTEALNHQEQFMEKMQNLLTHYLRAGDIVARCNRYQFVALLYDVTEKQCKKIEDRLYKKMGKLDWNSHIEVSFKEMEGKPIEKYIMEQQLP